jgi:hypothetical protein
VVKRPANGQSILTIHIIDNKSFIKYRTRKKLRHPCPPCGKKGNSRLSLKCFSSALTRNRCLSLQVSMPKVRSFSLIPVSLAPTRAVQGV